MTLLAGVMAVGLGCSGATKKDDPPAPHCAVNLGEKPALEVTPDDVGMEFGNHWEANCTRCHGSGISTNAFHPRMPAHPLMDMDSRSGAASALSRYCQSARNIPTEELTPTNGYETIRLVCTLIPPVPASPSDSCFHGLGMPSNTGTLAERADLLVPCERAFARYRTTISIWVDGGFGDGQCVDAGPGDAGM